MRAHRPGSHRDRPGGRSLPPPISARNRSVGRGRSGAMRPAALPTSGRSCTTCGAIATQSRRTCSSECEAEARAAQDKVPFYDSGPRRLAELRAVGVEPVGDVARARIADRQRERQRQENAWNATHPDRADPDTFRRGVLPGIQGVPIRELARRTGLSVAYCARIRRGEEVPHERWWEVLAPDARTTRG